MKLFKNQKGFNDVVTITILGGIIGALFILGVFVWKEIDKQNTLNDLYNKLSGVVKVEEEKVEVEEEWLTYTSEELGFSFDYPSKLGVFNLNIYKDLELNEGSGATGSSFIAFDENKNIYFGGASDNFSAGRGASLLDSRGYILKDDNYFLKLYTLDRDPISIEPVKIINTNDGTEILLLKKDSFDSPQLLIDDNEVVAVINLNNNTFKGIIFRDSDWGLFSQEEFEEMLISFKFLDNNMAIDYCESDDDCVPATCCHPTRVVNKNYAPDCAAVACTFSCEGPLDCGAGHPACENNKCVIAEGRLE
ncbi:hypothetical protein KKH39_01830 [Patescibacteria group bacterium]|nr:hypothetical protein [Patescibacteria group bacterium]